MKISKSKQELASIISENGGWRNEAKYSSQDKDGDVNFFTGKPEIRSGWTVWSRGFVTENSIYGQNVVKNWHQTILSRAEYFHLYPAPDADGWIKWEGGECPVERGTLVDVKYRVGHTQFGCRADDNCDGELYATTFWGVSGGSGDIIAYRLHKPEQTGAAEKLSDEAVLAAKSAPIGGSIDELARKPTIEQLATDYRNAKDYAERKQREADDAKADADAKLKVLELAGESLGLKVSPITTKQEPEMAITDWRDLRVGDLIQCVGDEWHDDFEGREAVVIEIEDRNYECEYRIRARIGAKLDWGRDFIFISRP